MLSWWDWLSTWWKRPDTNCGECPSCKVRFNGEIGIRFA